jgi:hypothetical protein
MGKKKNNTPRHRRMNRQRRLQAAAHWIPKYEGKKLINGYSKHFGVNKVCAVIELEMLGYSYSEAYKQELKDAEIQKQRDAERRIEQKEKAHYDEYCDETFAFIADYTPGGVPFGITWEEWERMDTETDAKRDNKPFTTSHPDLPF